MSFSFGDSSGSGSGGFNFGGNSSGSSGGGFGGTDNKSSDSGFNFGGTSSGSGSSSSGFSIGNDNKGSSSSTDFSFGSGSSSSGGNFSFGNDSKSSDFNFGGGSSSFSSGGSSNSSMLGQRIQAIFEAYNPESPRCCFNYFFYNVVTPTPDPTLVKNYMQNMIKSHSKYVSEKAFIDAWRVNKNPSRLVPVPARSFTDLSLRIEEQGKRTKAFITTLQSFEGRLEKIRTDHRVKTLGSIEELKEKHQKLSGRVLRLQSKAEVLMQRGNGLSGVDNHVKTKLDTMQEELHKPNEFRGRLNDLTPQFNQYVKDENRSRVQSEKLDDPMMMDRLVKFLAMQTEGLKHLSTVLKKDLNDTNLMILESNKTK